MSVHRPLRVANLSFRYGIAKYKQSVVPVKSRPRPVGPPSYLPCSSLSSLSRLVVSSTKIVAKRRVLCIHCPVTRRSPTTVDRSVVAINRARGEECSSPTTGADNHSANRKATATSIACRYNPPTQRIDRRRRADAE